MTTSGGPNKASRAGAIGISLAMKGLDRDLVKSLPNVSGWIAADYGVRLDGFGNHRFGRDDGSISYPNSRHQSRSIADPHIIADDGVALVGPLLWHDRLPTVTEYGKGIVRKPVGTVVAAVHNKFYVGGDRAEFADNQPVADEIKVVEHVALEIFGVFKIVVVGAVPDDDVGVGEDGFEVHQPGLSGNRMAGVRRRAVSHEFFGRRRYRRS